MPPERRRATLEAMSQIELFGTATSPYVRRVRIVLCELGLDYQLVNTAEPQGQERLREINPLWKVPTLRVDGQQLFDSTIIQRELLRRFGPGPLAPHDPFDVSANLLLAAIDGALDALINTFYLASEGLERSRAPYLEKQHERAGASMGWLLKRIAGGKLEAREGFGLPEIALVTTLDWMRFRDTYPVDEHPELLEVLAHHGGRESLATTLPPGYRPSYLESARS